MKTLNEPKTTNKLTQNSRNSKSSHFLEKAVTFLEKVVKPTKSDHYFLKSGKESQKRKNIKSEKVSQEIFFHKSDHLKWKKSKANICSKSVKKSEHLNQMHVGNSKVVEMIQKWIKHEITAIA